MDKKAEKLLKQLLNLVLEEAQANEAFGKKLEALLLPQVPEAPKDKPGKGDTEEKSGAKHSTTSSRRDPAVLNPTTVFMQEGEEALHARLSSLSEKELKDIIAQYGMDTKKLAMKWKSLDKLKGLIVDVSRTRAAKGDVFL